ncbi:MAG: GNAT family N-acetyltransferase, partial [Bacteroidota bacterium]
AIQALKLQFPAVVGEGRLSIDFATHFGLPQKRRVDMHLYRLDTLEEYPKYGTLRTTRKSDVDLLAVWIADFEDAIKAVKSQANYHQQALELIDRGTAYLYEVNGQPVAMAGSSRSAAGVACISLVYTPPELRGRGYASAAVGTLCEKLMETHQHCCLYADQANPASNKVYQRLGFFVVSDSIEIQFRKDEV